MMKLDGYCHPRTSLPPCPICNASILRADPAQVISLGDLKGLAHVKCVDEALKIDENDLIDPETGEWVEGDMGEAERVDDD